MAEKEKVVLGRPPVVTGRTYKLSTNCGNCYITVNHMGGEYTSDYRVIEVFATIGKSGGCATAILQGLTRMVSLALRAGIPIDKMIKTLRGVGCPSPFFGNTYLGKGSTRSCVDAVSRVLNLEAEFYESEKGGSAEEIES